MYSVRKTLAGLAAIMAFSCSLCACSNENQVSEITTDIPAQTTAVTEQTTVVATTTSTENIGDNSLDDFKYTVMTKSDYSKYGEDAIGKVIILDYVGNSDKVKIPSTCEGVEVIAIGCNAFEGTNITEVELPNSIRIIEDYAFSKCTNLVNISEISNLESLGRCVFEETQWLKNSIAGVGAEDTTEAIEQSTTETTSMTATTEAPVDDTVGATETEDISNKGIVVYSGWLVDGSTCSGTIDLSNDSEIKAIAKDAFRINTGITTVNLTGSSIKFIDDYAFSASSITVINLPVSLERFGESVFSKCNALENIDLSITNVTEISKNLFSDSAIKNVTLPKIVVDTPEGTLGDETTEDAEENVTTEETSGQSTSENTEESNEDITIGTSAGITLIGYGAFNNCNNLSHIDLGTELKVIEDYAFAGTSIKNIVLPDALETLGMRVFSNCSNLQSVTFGKTISSIGDEAFVKCEKLLKVTVPKSVQNVGKHAFGYTYTTNEKDLKKIDGLQIDCLKGSAIEKYCMNSDIKYNIIAST